MIKTTCIREKDFMNPVHMLTKEMSVEDTLKEMVEFELGYGGSVTYISKDLMTMKVITIVMAAKDTMTYTGPKDEMKDLISVGLLWMKNMKKVTPEMLVDEFEKFEASAKTPLLMSLSYPFLLAGVVKKEILKEHHAQIS